MCLLVLALENLLIQDIKFHLIKYFSQLFDPSPPYGKINVEIHEDHDAGRDVEGSNGGVENITRILTQLKVMTGRDYYTLILLTMQVLVSVKFSAADS